MKRLIGGGGVLLLLLCSAPTHAKFCGDDLDGVRVPCACGDVVASDTVLQPGDPVAAGRCKGHGLIIRADSSADTISLNLNGLALVGQGRGAGLKVESGGSDGASIVGGYAPRLGEVVGFAYGVVAARPGSLARLERVVAKANEAEGFVLRQAGPIVQDIVAERNGTTGIRILGSGGRFLGLRADENRYKGITVNAPGAVVSGSANRNGTHGVVAPAPRTELLDITAHGNKGHGVSTHTTRARIGKLDSRGNGKSQLQTIGRAAKEPVH